MDLITIPDHKDLTTSKAIALIKHHSLMGGLATEYAQHSIEKHVEKGLEDAFLNDVEYFLSLFDSRRDFAGEEKVESEKIAQNMRQIITSKVKGLMSKQDLKLAAAILVAHQHVTLSMIIKASSSMMKRLKLSHLISCAKSKANEILDAKDADESHKDAWERLEHKPQYISRTTESVRFVNFA